MRAAGLVTSQEIREAFERSAPDLYRYPAIVPDTYRADLDAALSDTADAVIRQRPSGQTP